MLTTRIRGAASPFGTWQPLLLRAAPLLLCGALVAFGLLHLVYGAFVTRVIPATATTEQAGAWAPYLAGTLLILAGLLMLRRGYAENAALLVAALLFLSFSLLHLPIAWEGPAWGGAWTNAFKMLALCGGCLALADLAPTAAPGAPTRRQKWAWMGRVFFSAYLMLAGIQHFIWASFVATLIPAWIPAPGFWVYFTAVALIAGAVGMLVPKTTRAAAWWTGIMIFLWVWLLHVPRALGDWGNTNETVGVFEALAFTGIAWLIHGTATPRPAQSKGDFSIEPVSSVESGG